MPSGTHPESAQSIELNEYVLWQHRDARIYFHPEAVRALSSDALTHLGQDVEIGGVLWGKAGPDNSVVIVDAKLVPAAGPRYNTTAVDTRAIVQALSGHSPGPTLAPVGYFRTHLREGLFLSEQDRTLIEQHFREPESVFLILKPFQAGVCTAGFFFWRGGHVPNESELEVPFLATGQNAQQESPALRNGKPQEASIVDILRESAMRHDGPRAAAKSSVESPSVLPTGGEVKKQSPWPRLIMVALIALLVPVGVAIAYLEWPALRSLVQRAPAKPPEAGIGLKVARGPDGQLALSWNQNSPEIEHARDGTLFIRDGRRSPKLPLDNAQLRSGKLLYSPKSASVQFRLELNMDGGRTIQESLRLSPPATEKKTARDKSRTNGRSSGLASGNHFPIGTTEVLVPTGGEENSRLPSGPPLPASTLVLPGTADASTQSDAGVNGGNYVAPRVVQEMMPQSTPVGRFAQISVHVTIDPQGQVATARAAEAVDSSNSALAAPAIAAARQWRFRPATLNGTPVPAEYTIVFAFRPAVP